MTIATCCVLLLLAVAPLGALVLADAGAAADEKRAEVAEAEGTSCLA